MTAGRRNVAHETSPLLAPSAADDGDSGGQGADRAHGHGSKANNSEPGIPWGQVAVLSYARMIEGWNCFCIFSYIAEYIESVGVEQSKIGFYTAIIDSIYSVTQFFAMQFVWRKASDKYGRKPVLVVSLAGLSASAVGFGLCTNVWHMILWRSLGGVFSGSLVTVRVMFAEISAPSTRVRVFSFFSLAGTLSTFLGPLTGGLLARPADRFPLLKDVAIFQAYPYLLPSLSTGLIGGLACILSASFLKETKPWTNTDQIESPSTMSILRSRGVSTVLRINIWASFINFAYSTVVPIFWYTKPALGGLGLSSQAISVFLAIGGVYQAFMLLLLCAPLQKLYGTDGILLRAGFLLAVTCGAQPFLNLVARHASLKELYALLLACIVLTGLQSMTFNAIQVAVIETCPTPEAMAKINSLYVSSGIVVRVFAPAVAPSTFAFGVEHRILHGQFFWYLVCIFAAGYLVFLFASRKTLKAIKQAHASAAKVAASERDSSA